MLILGIFTEEVSFKFVKYNAEPIIVLPVKVFSPPIDWVVVLSTKLFCKYDNFTRSFATDGFVSVLGQKLLNVACPLENNKPRILVLKVPATVFPILILPVVILPPILQTPVVILPAKDIPWVDVL